MISDTQEMPLLDQVLHLYDKSSTKVLAYFSVALVATITALTLDEGFGIAPASVLVYVSVLMAVLLIGGSIAYIAYRAFHRPQSEDVLARVSETSLENEQMAAEASRAASFLRALAFPERVLSKRYAQALEDASEAFRISWEQARSKEGETPDDQGGLKIKAQFYYHIAQHGDMDMWKVMRPGHELSVFRRQLEASSISEETKVILNRVVMAVWTCRRPTIQEGKSADFRDGCDYGFNSTTQALMREVMQIPASLLSSEELPDAPLPFDTPLPDVYPGFFKPRKTK